MTTEDLDYLEAFVEKLEEQNDAKADRRPDLSRKYVGYGLACSAFFNELERLRAQIPDTAPDKVLSQIISNIKEMI